MKKNLALICAAALSLAACQPEPPPAPTPTPTPSPADYLQASAAAMADLYSVQFEVAHEGAPVVLDPTLNATFVSATGSYESPDRVHASVKADLSGSVLALDMLWLPEGNYISNPLTASYQTLPEEVPLDPLAMFSSETGLSHILAVGLPDPVFVGTESTDAGEARHIASTASAEVLAALVPFPVEGEIVVDVWLAVDSDYLLRVEVTEASGDKTIVEFFAFDEPVTIPSP